MKSHEIHIYYYNNPPDLTEEMTDKSELRHDHRDGFIILRNGIMECYLHPVNEVDMEQAQYTSEVRIEFSKGISYPCLFDITTVKKFTNEARNYLANEGNKLVVASALLINSPVRKMAANFFIAVNKPKNPTRLFTDKEEALKWLSQFKKVEEASNSQNNSN